MEVWGQIMSYFSAILKCIECCRLAASSGTKGLVARIGIAEGLMIKMCPHKATGTQSPALHTAPPACARVLVAHQPGFALQGPQMLVSLVSTLVTAIL